MMIVSRTIVPMQIRSHPASLSRVICALKSVVVGANAAVPASRSFIALTWTTTPAWISLPKSVSWYIEPMTFLPFVSAKYFTQARI